jgi:hypothetical protein
MAWAIHYSLIPNGEGADTIGLVGKVTNRKLMIGNITRQTKAI